MKKLILLSMLLIVGCSKPINDETLIEEDGLYYHSETKELYSGQAYKNRLGGKVQFECAYKDGKKNGKWTEYYKNGQIKKEGNYKDGKGDGKWTFYDEEGSLIGEGIYQNGLKWSGFFIDYYENGQIKEHGIYKDGEKEGKWTYYNEDGSIKNILDYVEEDDDIVEIWDKAKQFREGEYFKESIASLKIIIEKHPDHDLSAKAQFQIADIYLNDMVNFEYAVNEFKKMVEKYPTHEVGKKALFMVAYIYNNYLNSYNKAIDFYNLFKEKYPKDDLIPSVEWELEGL